MMSIATAPAPASGSVGNSGGSVPASIRSRILHLLDRVLPLPDLARLVIAYGLEGQLIVGTRSGYVSLWAGITRPTDRRCTVLINENRPRATGAGTASVEGTAPAESSTRVSSVTVWPNTELFAVTTNHASVSLWCPPPAPPTALAAGESSGGVSDGFMGGLNSHDLWVYSSAALAPPSAAAVAAGDGTSSSPYTLVTGSRDLHVCVWDVPTALQRVAAQSPGASFRVPPTPPPRVKPAAAPGKKGKPPALPVATVAAYKWTGVERQLPPGAGTTRSIGDAHDQTVYCVVALPGAGGSSNGSGSPRNSATGLSLAAPTATPPAAATAAATRVSTGGFVTGSVDGIVKVWAAAPAHNCVATIKAFERNVYALCVVPPYAGTAAGDVLIAAGSSDGTVCIFAIGEFLASNKPAVTKPTAPLPAGTPRAGLARALRVLGPASDASSVYCLAALPTPPPSPLAAAAAAASGVPAAATSRIAAGYGDSKIRIWNAATGECMRLLDAHTDWVHSLLVIPESGLLVSGGKDRKVIVWSIAPNSVGRLTSFDVGAAVECLAFLPDSTLM